MNRAEKVALACAITAVLGGSVMVYKTAALEQRCNAAGYPRSSFFVFGPSYCISIADGGHAIPVDSVRK